MNSRNLCIKPNPDFGRLDKVLRRKGVPDKVPFYELFSNIQDDVLRTIGKLPDTTPHATNAESEEVQRRKHITYMLNLGYDYVNSGGRGFCFPRNEWAKPSEGGREYALAGSHTIGSRKDFERYPWPEMSQVDYSPLETITGVLPEGMGVIAGHSGVLENVMWLLGYEGISYLVHDDERLVIDMFEAVAIRIATYLETCASFDSVGAVQMGEDMGFKTQTMLSPDMYRKYLFPWHKRIVDAAHRHDKPIILHSCGNLSNVMEDIIDCGWDAKHSFEDQIEPVWEAKSKYGDRIALLGGFDMDKISRMSEGAVREHTRFLIDRCASGGGWALGTGNSVADYVPVGNFLTMLEEGYDAGRYE